MVLLADYGGHIARTIPDARLRRVLVKALTGIVTQRSPVIARMVALAPTSSKQAEAPAKQVRRFFANERVTRRAIWKGIYADTRRLVDQERPTVVPVVLDGVNWEKPYARKLPGLSTIRKPTAANRQHDQELTKGFPALAAVALAGGRPALTYAHIFSYTDAAFVSVKRETRRAVRTSRAVLSPYRVRFIGDKEFDDDQVLPWMAEDDNQFLVRAYHNRTIDVWDPTSETWRRTSMQECAETLPLRARFTATFTHARRKRHSVVRLDYCRIRLPEAPQVECWLIVAHALIFKKALWLLTNVPITDLAVAEALWWEYRERPRIEDLFRLLQERGLDIEDVRLRKQERIEKLMALVWAAAQFLWQLSLTLHQEAQAWLRRVGGKPAETRGSDGLYLLLYGIGAVLLEHLVPLLRRRWERSLEIALPP